MTVRTTAVMPRKTAVCGATERVPNVRARLWCTLVSGREDLSSVTMGGMGSHRWMKVSRWRFAIEDLS